MAEQASESNATPVVLSHIVTRRGDMGLTDSASGERLRKASLRISAVADVEESNAVVGVALYAPDLLATLAAKLRAVQNHLFDVGSLLAMLGPGRAGRSLLPHIQVVEEFCEELNAGLTPLRSFILPRGSAAVAGLHHARTVVRRCERTVWTAIDAGHDMEPTAAPYLNRLSDFLFIASRVQSINTCGEEYWQPGEI